MSIEKEENNDLVFSSVRVMMKRIEVFLETEDYRELDKSWQFLHDSQYLETTEILKKLPSFLAIGIFLYDKYEVVGKETQQQIETFISDSAPEIRGNLMDALWNPETGEWQGKVTEKMVMHEIHKKERYRALISLSNNHQYVLSCISGLVEGLQTLKVTTTMSSPVSGTKAIDEFLYSTEENINPKKFTVEIHEPLSDSKILSDDEAPGNQMKIVQVPEEHREAFEKDMEQALKDIAGVM